MAPACASSQEKPAVSGPPQQAPPGTAAPLEGLPAPSPSPSPALEQLTADVRGMPGEPGAEGASHEALVKSLRDLGGALAQLPGVGSSSVAPVLDAAQRLEEAPASSYLHADLLKQGLAAALRALLSRSTSPPEPPSRAAAYRDALAGFGAALGAIQGDHPLPEQEPAVSRTFRVATNAVYLASSLQPPFPPAPNEQRSSPAALQRALSEAQQALLELAQARWPNARASAARALSALADVADSLDRNGAASGRVASIRLQAERLSSANLLSLDQTKWLATGLRAALDVLDVLPAAHAAFVSAWRSAAREAVNGLSEGDTLAFQAGAVQDGFRATLDTYLAASRAESACR